MSRKEEVENNIKFMCGQIEKIQDRYLNPEQIMNINLSAITQQLTNISVTLAMISDHLSHINENKTSEREV